MTYDTIEASIDGARPDELYWFQAGSTSWRLTSSTKNQLYLGNWYENTFMIKRSNRVISQNSFKNQLNVTVDAEFDLATRWLNVPPDEEVTLQIFRGHSEADYIIYWRGSIANVVFIDDTYCKFQCIKGRNKLRRPGLSLLYSRLCVLPFFSQRCGLSKWDYYVTGTLDSVSGLVLTSTTFGTQSDGFFENGYVDVGGYKRKIVFHSGNNITIQHPIPNLIPSLSYNAFAGCDGLPATCSSRFNKINYGGFEYLPNRNPFRGDGIG